MYLFGRTIKKIVRATGTQPYRGRISRLCAILQLIQIDKLDSILARFVANGQFVVRSLADLPAVKFPQSSDDCAYTKLILVLHNGDTGALATHLLKRGVEIEWSYKPLDLRSEFAVFRRFRNSYAESIWSRLLVLPVHPWLSDGDVSSVARAVESFFQTN